MLEPKEALTLFFERSNAMQTYWGFYISVVFGVLAFFGAAKRTRSTAAWITLAFVGFAFVNFDGITDVARQRIEALQYLIRPVPACDLKKWECHRHYRPVVIESPLLMTLNPPPLLGIEGFHLLIDGVTIVAIWGLTLRRTTDGI